MPAPVIVPTEDDRRRHPRQQSHHPLVIEMMRDGELIPCDSLDVSIGGMRVRAMEPVPLGPCDIVVFADTEDPLILMGEVLEIVESTAEQTIARIVFLPILTDSADAGRGPDAVDHALPAAVADAPVRRRGIILLAAAITAGLVSIVGAHVAAQPGEPTPEIPAAAVSDLPATAEAVPEASAAVSAVAPPVAPVVATTAAPVAAPAPMQPVQRAVAPPDAPPAADPAPAPPAAATHVEHADNLVHVTLGTTAEDTSASSFVGPSEGVDRFRVQLNVTPEPDGTSLPLQVTFENRGDTTVTFADGFHAIITSTRDGVAVATATFVTDITEVAPGEVIAVEQLFDFGSTGEHDLTVDVDVTE
jgi:hypothetical protein